MGRAGDAGAGGGIDRRTLLRAGLVAGLGSALAPAIAAGGGSSGTAGEPPRIRRRVRLGRTGLVVGDIGFGASRLRGDVRLVEHALARGIDYFDTADRYADGESERTLGRALAGRRDDVVIVSKTKATKRDRREALMRRLEGSLRRLRSDRVEIYLNHAVNDVERVTHDEWWEFTQQAKQQGKIRFSGISGHGGRLAACIDRALDEDLLDVMLVAWNFGSDPSLRERFTRGFDFVATQPELPRLVEKARRRDVGVVAMKTLLGARRNDMAPYETPRSTFAQAAFRWVFSNPHVDLLIVSMKSEATIDEYLGASGARGLAPRDARLLGRYLAMHSRSQCRQGCSSCSDVCPHGVGIDDVLRARMYALDYEDAGAGEALYAQLQDAGASATACLSCSGAPCAGSCPYGLDLHRLLRGAQQHFARA